MGIWIPHHIKGNYSYHGLTSVRLLVTMEFASVTQEDCIGYIRHSGYIM